MVHPIPLAKGPVMASDKIASYKISKIIRALVGEKRNHPAEPRDIRAILAAEPVIKKS
jgi:hypothetical protein